MGSSTRFTPTSITTAPGLTMSALTKWAWPIAAMMMSARRQCSAMFRLREWSSVTVASACVVLLQEDRRHRLAHDVAAAEDDDFRAAQSARRVRISSSWTPAGRAGPEERILAEQQFADVDGMEAVDVLAVSIALKISSSLIWLRQRRLDQDAVHVRIAVQFLDEREQFRPAAWPRRARWCRSGCPVRRPWRPSSARRPARPDPRRRARR